jgi:hypothetical protein
MNSDVKALIRGALNESREQEKRLAAFYKKIEKNNRRLYLEIYKNLIDQFKSKPISYTEHIGLTLNFRSIEFASDEDKEILKTLEREQDGYGLFTTSDNEELLVDVKKVKEELVADGFYDDPRVLLYTFAGWKKEDRQNDNTFEIDINLYRFRKIIEAGLKSKRAKRKLLSL